MRGGGGGRWCVLLKAFAWFCIVGKSNVCTAYVTRIVAAGVLVFVAPWSTVTHTGWWRFSSEEIAREKERWKPKHAGKENN